MASDGKLFAKFEDDEDLEALRWAALQTLKQSVAGPGSNVPQDSSGRPSFLTKDTSVGSSRTRIMRNDGYNRHRITSNLITIVPTVQGDSLSHNAMSANGKNQSGRHGFPVNSGGVETKEEEETQVSTKFTRFHDSSDESSSEESEVESSSSDDTETKDLADSNTSPVRDEDENSLDRLMDELEQEINDGVTKPTEICNSESKNVTADTNSGAKKSVNSSKNKQNSGQIKNLKPVNNTSFKKKVKKTVMLGKGDLKNVIENHKNGDSVMSNSTVCQRLPITGVPTTEQTESDVTSKVPVLPRSVAESPVSSRLLHNNPVDRKSQSRSSSESPIRNSDSVVIDNRKSRSRSPLPKFYYSSPRSFHSKSPRYSRSPRHSRSPRRSRSPYYSRSIHHSRSPRSLSPRRSRSPFLSKASFHSRSPHRSTSLHRSRSPISRTLRRSRSRSFHRSRSPYQYRSPRRSPLRQRSPRSLRSSWSPRRRYPSPNHYSSNSHSYGRSQASFSPRRQSRSPRGQSFASPIRRLKSPRRSLSPSRSISPRRIVRSPVSPQSRRLSPRRPLSPRRSPVRRTFPPRRQSLSPTYRKNSKSPIRKLPHSPQSRRSVSPRRLSPAVPRGQFSPSLRRHVSPGHRNLHQNSSPSGRHASRSASHSPRRHSPVRNRSPVFHRTHARSPSPRRKSSKSPIGRSVIQHSSPSRKLSPWSSPVLRHSPSKHRHSASEGRRSPLSPYKQQLGGSNPLTARSREKFPQRSKTTRMESKASQSPRRGDSHKYIREVRNAGNLRSRSPPSSPIPEKRSILNSSSQHKKYNRSPSLSLSPSPERKSVNELQPIKSSGSVEFSVADSVKERSSAQTMLDSTTVTKRRSRSSVHKDSRARFKKKILTRGQNVVVKVALPGDRSQQRSRIVSSENSSSINENEHEVTDPNISSVMEARRRKFESCEPVELSNKRIRLKPIVSETSDPSKSEIDDSEFMLDLGISDKELVMWSDGENPVDTEGRFTSPEKSGATCGEQNKASSGNRSDKLPSRNVLIKVPEDQPQRPWISQKPGNKSDEPSGPNKEFKEPPFKMLKRRVIATRSSEVQNSLESKADSDQSSVEPESGEDGTTAGKTMDLARSKEGDLRAELSRRRAERLTKIGSLHEVHPSRLVRSAFKDAVGIKSLKKKVDKTENPDTTKKIESSKGPEKSDRRVLLLKSVAVEHRIPSFSVTFAKDSKLKENSPTVSKLPIRLRLGLPPTTGDEGENSTLNKRGVRKVKLKRSVTVTSGSSSGDQV